MTRSFFFGLPARKPGRSFPVLLRTSHDDACTQAQVVGRQRGRTAAGSSKGPLPQGLSSCKAHAMPLWNCLGARVGRIFKIDFPSLWAMRPYSSSLSQNRGFLLEPPLMVLTFLLGIWLLWAQAEKHQRRETGQLTAPCTLLGFQPHVGRCGVRHGCVTREPNTGAFIL